MAFLTESFDINELPVGNTGSFEPLPAGWYTCTISQAELKATKANNGQYIKLRYDPRPRRLAASSWARSCVQLAWPR